MADVVEHVHETSGGGDSGMGFFLGMIVLIIFVIFFLYYGVPMLRNAGGGPQIQIPNQFDVNVNQKK